MRTASGASESKTKARLFRGSPHYRALTAQLRRHRQLQRALVRSEHRIVELFRRFVRHSPDQAFARIAVEPRLKDIEISQVCAVRRPKESFP